MRRKISESDSDTRGRLLDVATKLFGSRSFESVSVRDITSRAKANLGAVNYYFGSKVNLIREVLKTLAAPIDAERVRSLHAYLGTLNGARPEIETVVRILVEPFIRASKDKKGRGIYYPRLIILARTVPGNLIGPYISDQHDAMARQYVSAFVEAVPDLTEEEACWRYEFIIGAALNIVGDGLRSYRLKRLSNGKCDTDDPDRIVEELVTFVAAGMLGKLPKHGERKTPRFATKSLELSRSSSR